MTTLVVVGAGPGGTSLLERLVANAPELAGSDPIDVHVIDPHPPGAGRVWRQAQSPLLWMNSMAEDVTMFTDASVVCEGPIAARPRSGRVGRRTRRRRRRRPRRRRRAGRGNGHDVPHPPAPERLPRLGVPPRAGSGASEPLHPRARGRGRRPHRGLRRGAGGVAGRAPGADPRRRRRAGARAPRHGGRQRPRRARRLRARATGSSTSRPPTRPTSTCRACPPVPTSSCGASGWPSSTSWCC